MILRYLPKGNCSAEFVSDDYHYHNAKNCMYCELLPTARCQQPFLCREYIWMYLILQNWLLISTIDNRGTFEMVFPSSTPECLINQPKEGTSTVGDLTTNRHPIPSSSCPLRPIFTSNTSIFIAIALSSPWCLTKGRKEASREGRLPWQRRGWQRLCAPSEQTEERYDCSNPEI